MYIHSHGIEYNDPDIKEFVHCASGIFESIAVITSKRSKKLAEKELFCNKIIAS